MDQAFIPQQLEQMAQQRREMMDRLTPQEPADLQLRREEATSGLSPDQLTEMRQHRRRLLPDSWLPDS
jgi:hypothetical protein